MSAIRILLDVNLVMCYWFYGGKTRLVRTDAGAPGRVWGVATWVKLRRREARMQEDIAQQSRTLFDLIRRFWSCFGQHLNAVLDRRGLNVPQYMALVALDQLGETTMGQLSKKLHLTMGASTNLVDKLIRGAFVSRTRGTEDRRVVKVRLEAKGREVLHDVEEKAVSFMTGALAEVEPDRRRQFIESYNNMVVISESKDTAAAFAGPDS